MTDRFRAAAWGAPVILILVIVVALLVARRTSRDELGFDPVAAAKTLYEEARGEGVDLSRGPCLGLIAPGWIADVAHDPRQPVDDDPANQCAEFRSGTAKHFVELTPDGRLIRVR